MTEQFIYINQIANAGYALPAFESDQHERHVYASMTGHIILLAANGEPFVNNEDGVLDSLLEKAQESWNSFNVEFGTSSLAA